MSYADDLLDQTPAPQREGFTSFPHWRVTQAGPQGATTNWFSNHAEAAFFQLDHGGTITGVSCEDFESAWPWRRPHTHGASSDGERQRATELDTARSDANDCRVYWGSHGCELQRGHSGSHFCCCECVNHPDTGCVGTTPYYGDITHFYGEDARRSQRLGRLI